MSNQQSKDPTQAVESPEETQTSFPSLEGGPSQAVESPEETQTSSPSLEGGPSQAMETPEETQTSSPSLEGKDLLGIYDDENNKNENYYRDAVEKAKAEGPSEKDSRDQSTPDSWIKRNSLMVRLTGNHPFNSEPPLDKLMDHGFITPVPLHYVRNHGQVPRADWSTWTVEVCGKVKKSKKFTMEELIKKFPSKVFPATLVCAGNRRKEQKMVKKTKGFNWGAAGISTSMWKGVPLHLVLDHCEVYSKEEKAFNVCFEGAENLARGGGSRGAKYGTSIKIEFAMDPGRDIIIAYMQNGEILAEDHGFPVRMIIPGFIGGRMVKWLKRIIVTEKESNSYYHFKDNRVFPSHVDLNLANSEAWWYKPEYIINELNINSVITTPSHEMTLPINSLTKKETLRGYAYSGGGKKVTRVEVTMDGGEMWHVCNVDHREKPNEYGKYWCWCFWSLEVEVLDLFRANEIAVRAWDETLNTQPEKLIWNLMGMMNNCWFRVKIRECVTDNGEKGLIFEHPTQPSNQSGGWMVREKHLKSSADSTPFKNTSSKVYSVSDLERHNLPHSAWIAVHGHVYDCTPFLKRHPGGEDSILVNAGTDCTEVFDEIHSDYAYNLLENYRIGELITSGCISALARNIALVPQEKVPCILVEKTSLSHDVRRFRFSLPLKDQVLGLPVGKHIILCATINGEPCMREYTPISSVDEVGFFDLLVKIYFKNEEFPNGGLMSNYLDTLPLESSIDVKGPVGHIEYKGKGEFTVYGEQKSAKKLAMIAGGTGITPIYQVMQAILKDPEDDTEMNVVYANHTEDDILMKEELDNWANEYQDRVKVCYVVGKKIKEGGKYSVGRIDEGIMREHLPEASVDVLALVCGPPPMIESAVNPNLEKMGYDLNRSLLEF